MKLINLKGKQFGLATVIRRVENDKWGNAKWLIKCKCGKTAIRWGSNLRVNKVSSCGCYNYNTTHGHCRNYTSTPEYGLWKHAKNRANKYGLEFTLKVEDIHIPKRCPVLGILLVQHKVKAKPNSPSIDKVVPREGYTKKNTWVISRRANSIKSNASLIELQRLVKALRKKLCR